MIIFNYRIEEILNSVQMNSLYKSTALLNQGSDTVVDDTAISDEDTIMAQDFLLEGCSLVVDAMSGYSTSLLDNHGVEHLPFEFDAEFDDIPHCVVFRVEMPTFFNTSVIHPLDKQIKATLVSYVLMRMAKMKGLEYQSYQEDHETALSKVMEYLTRRTRTVTRSYKFI